LNIAYTFITNAGFAHLTQGKMKMLDISGCPQITPAGVQHLQPRIPALNMSRCAPATVEAAAAAGHTVTLNAKGYPKASEGYLDANHVHIPGSEGLTPAGAAALHNRLYTGRTPLNAEGVFPAAFEGYLDANHELIPGSYGLTPAAATALYNRDNPGRPPLNAAVVTRRWN
jgi:hypothetical protein